MELLGGKGVTSIAGTHIRKRLILICWTVCMMSGRAVYAQEDFHPVYEIPDKTDEEYLLLTEDKGEYQVVAGDCLWEIAETVWGDGTRYPQLIEYNADCIDESGMIYPGMTLQLIQPIYIKKQTGQTGVWARGQYYVDAPYDWKFGILESGDAYANFALYPGSAQMSGVACLLRDKEQVAVKSLEDWGVFQQIIQKYVQNHYEDCVSNLSFERLRTQTGEDIYLYSYLYAIDLRNYGMGYGKIHVIVCQGIKQTQQLQAEFTGFCMLDPQQSPYTDTTLYDTVRYMTASFEELVPEQGTNVSVEGANISIQPSAAWDLTGIHNPFVWIETYFHGILCEITNTPLKEKSAKEEILDHLHSIAPTR